ncbi:hypothetical protein HKD37_02G004876 [Glycine soja]
MKMDMNVGYLISLTAQHDTSRHGFPALITALCKASGKNYWNVDDLTVTFRGPRKARGERSEAPSTSASSEAPTPSSSTLPPSFSIEIPMIPSAPTQIPLPALLSIGLADFIFTPQMLHSML